MDILLGKLTQHTINYAIRSGIAITSTYAIKECSRLLKTVDDSAEYQELQALQQRLDSKIRIISPAIDMIELISARGNTTLESAVSLTKALRWDIQTLAVRLSKAASAEEISQRSGNRASTRAQHKVELRLIVKDIQTLLQRIEDAVPLINLAITTSGASLSTSLPATVSPSRLLQASTFLTAGDTQFSMNPNSVVQVGPTFILSIYMLFTGHTHRAHFDKEGVRDNTWKEAIHKARVKLIRIPLATYGYDNSSTNRINKSDEDLAKHKLLSGDGKANEFAYQVQIIEDLDDDRVHSLDDEETQPGPYEDVLHAGIRETVPIHQVSKIFYADTGKILNIGGDGEANSPVLLLKRDINALPPRRMMEHSERDPMWRQDIEQDESKDSESSGTLEHDTQSDIDHQILRESSVEPKKEPVTSAEAQETQWRFPPNLDPEWLAFEVYVENETDNSDDEQEASDDSAYASKLPSSARRNLSPESHLISDLAQLHLKSPPLSATSTPRDEQQISTPLTKSVFPKATNLTSTFGPIRSSLSLLEMIIRLTALQQFQQASHLSIPDELLTFFLEESSTTGAGGDGDERRRKRHEARQKVGFDPYDESPVKRRGEEYQYSYRNREQDDWPQGSREGTPYSIREYDSQSEAEWYRDNLNNPLPSRERSSTPSTRVTPEPWQSHTNTSTALSSPQSPYLPSRRTAGAAPRPLDRVQMHTRENAKTGVIASPLGRGFNTDTDSSLGTSPGTPTLSPLARARGQGHGHGKVE